MSPQKKFTVAVMGAAGGVGQPLSLLMKLSPYVSDLRLYDVVPAIDGVAADLSHVCTSTKVSSFYGPSDDSQATASALEACLSGVDYVLITAGTTMKPGMDTRDKLFNTNAKIIDSLVSAACDECPEAKILIITNPVNSLVPAASQVMRKKGIRDWEKKLFGSSTLDVFRAATFLAQELNTDPSELVSRVRIFGGHSGETILPIFSLISKDLSNPEKLIRKVQEAGMTVYHAKENKGTATLSMALAASRFIEKLMKAANGETVTECTFVSSQGIDGIENCKFFTLPVTFDKSRVTEVHGLPNDMSEVEKRMLKDEVIPKLKKDIQQGLEHASM